MYLLVLHESTSSSRHWSKVVGYRLYSEYSVPTDLKLSANRPDLLRVDAKDHIAHIIDVSVPFENNINKKIAEKRSK